MIASQLGSKMSMIVPVQRTRDPEIAAALAYQAIDLCQAKPGTVPQFLGCKQPLDRLGGACIRGAIPVVDTVATSHTPRGLCPQVNMDEGPKILT
jgi:hypothetical protein